MKSILKLASLLTILVLNACVSQKKIVYFQDPDGTMASAERIAQNYVMRIKPADRVSIAVYSDTKKLLEPFANTLELGATSGSSASGLNEGRGYTVDPDGYITVPLIGRLKAEGLTEAELAKLIEQKIVEKGFISEPQVTVSFANARVSVLGAVASPGVVKLTSQRSSILDVLASCGDITDNGLRTNVTLFREVNGERVKYIVDLTKADVFKSPAFYVQQNDLIYVEPNRSSTVKSSPFFTFWSAGASILGVVISVTSLVVALSK